MGGVLAIDHGERKTGFATTDGLRLALHPLETFRHRDDAELLDHIAELLEERDVTTLLLGLPLNMDGSEGPRAAATRAFGERVRKRFPACELLFYDERLTTKEAEARLREAGYRTKEIRRRRDCWSAMVLLQDWIESGEPGH